MIECEYCRVDEDGEMILNDLINSEFKIEEIFSEKPKEFNGNFDLNVGYVRKLEICVGIRGNDGFLYGDIFDPYEEIKSPEISSNAIKINYCPMCGRKL